jgi:hypothetical protein
MNIYGQPPKLNYKITTFLKKHAKGSMPGSSIPEKLDKLVVLGDGTPDDYGIVIASHHLNGNDTVGMVKPPEKRGTSIFSLLPSFIRETKTLRGLLFILDQENLPISSIYKELEKQIGRSVNEFKCSRDDFKGRLKVYDCIIGNRVLHLVLVINGRSDIKTKKHMIEDHFLKAASMLELAKLPESIDNPKEYWQATILTEIQENIFHCLSEDSERMKICFPQQFAGCQILKALGR